MGCGFSKPPEVDTNIEPPSATIDLYYKEVIGNFVAVNSVEDSTFNTKISVKFVFDSVKHEWIQGASEPAHILSIFIGKSGFDVLTKLNEVVGEVEPKPSVISNISHAKIYPGTLLIIHFFLNFTYKKFLFSIYRSTTNQTKGSSTSTMLIWCIQQTWSSN